MDRRFDTSAGLAVSFCCISGNFFDLSSFDLCTQYIRSNTIPTDHDPIDHAIVTSQPHDHSNLKGLNP